MVNYPSVKIWLRRHRTSVRTFRVGVIRNKFLPLSPREFCPLLFQKALEMIDKSESINWANFWWILAADNLTFEEVIGNFRKKFPVDWFRGGKACKDKPGRNNILHWKKNSLITYIMLKKILHSYNQLIFNFRGLGKKFLPKLYHLYPPPPRKSNGQPHRRWWRRGRNLTP